MQKVYKKYHINMSFFYMSIRYKKHNTFYIDFYPDTKVTCQFLIGTVLLHKGGNIMEYIKYQFLIGTVLHPNKTTCDWLCKDETSCQFLIGTVLRCSIKHFS